MSYKAIVVHADEDPRTPERIRIAAAVALAGGGHLSVAALTGVSRFLYQNGAASSTDPHLALHLGMLRERAARALSGVAGQLAALGLADWDQRVLDDEPGGGISLLARYADLVVIGQHNRQHGASSVMRDFPAYVVINAARPVLIVPSAGQAGAAVGRRIVIAWNASREASRAVSAALPLLRRADSVHIAVLDTRRHDAAHGPQPGAEIALYLARHGVASTLSVQADEAAGLRRPSGVGEALLALAAGHGADLLVMGAYGHSRFRETVLGGVTRTVLGSMTLPVLMCH